MQTVLMIDAAELARRRLQRKAARADFYSTKKRLPTLSLSINGDTLLFNGKTYDLFFAHGGLQIDSRLKADLRSQKYTTDERLEVFEVIKKLVAESPCSGNIIGAAKKAKA